ncbi:hypothetical protein ACJMK2_036549 [Sinanodonta woodiana]|uniref:Nudix hydrolase domain-containing protein n=1 Tax=Sinanodonta woodiana TaxID=1069815 RepID=A0ABD3WLP4_SINWO
MSLLIDVVNIIFATKSGHLTDKSKVKISLDKSYNRQILPSKQEENIDTIWKKRLHENPTLFNGTKFRLQSAQYNESDMNLHLNMGVTCYKDFLGTNWSPDALSLQSLGLERHDDSQAYLSDALGVGALLRTADDKMIILKRSDQCGEDQGKWDRPGGHAEPKEVYGDIPMEMIELNPSSSEAVVKELFSSIIGEVVDEVNIPAQYLDEPKIIGLFRNTLNTGKPNMEFIVGCSLDSKEVIKMYHEGVQKESFESTNIRAISMEDVLTIQQDDPETWESFAPGARGVIILYKMYHHRFTLGNK